MAFRINHVHVKSKDPGAAADWFVNAFGFKVVSDEVRAVGDRFIRCQTGDASFGINFSGPRTGETLPDGLIGPHLGLEHFGLDSTDLDGDIARLVAAGAVLEEGPMNGRAGSRIAFLGTPPGVRIELIQRG